MNIMKATKTFAHDDSGRRVIAVAITLTVIGALAVLTGPPASADIVDSGGYGYAISGSAPELTVFEQQYETPGQTSTYTVTVEDTGDSLLDTSASAGNTRTISDAIVIDVPPVGSGADWSVDWGSKSYTATGADTSGLTVSWHKAEDGDGDVDLIKVDLEDTDSANAVDINKFEITFSATATTVEDNFSWEISMKDNALNESTATATTIVDGTAPTVPSDAVIQPNGGENIKGGSSYTIKWDSAAVSDDVALTTNPIKIEYYDGSSWSNVEAATANDGSWNWSPVPSDDTENAWIRITATDEAGNTASDTSDDNFTVDNTAPTYDSATTQQSGKRSAGNNVIDLSFTEAGSGLDPASIQPTDFSIGGSQIDGVGDTATLSGTTVTLTYDNSYVGIDALDTGDTPVVGIVGSLSDKAGNSISSGTNTPSDNIKPVVLSAKAEDTDGNSGYLDKITLTMSETLTSNNPTAAAFTVKDEDGTSLTVADAAAGGASTSAGLNFSSSSDTVVLELGDAAGTTGQPTLTYTAGKATEVMDSAGNKLDNVSPTVTDSAIPKVMDISYKDVDNNALVERVDVKYSENIKENSVFDSDYWSFSTNPEGLVILPGGTGISYDTVQIEVENAPANSTLLSATNIDYTGDNIADLAGNKATAPSAASLSDGAEPVVVSTSTSDSEPDGTPETVTLVMSETLVDVASGTTGAYTLEDESGASLNVSDVEIGTGSAADNEVVVSTDTSTKTTGNLVLSYDKTVSAEIKDPNANETASFTLTTSDGMKPIITSIATKDYDNNGLVDMYEVSLTENVDDSTFDGTIIKDDTFELSGSLASPSGDVTDDSTLYLEIVENSALNTADVGDFTTTQENMIADLASAANWLENIGTGDVTESDGASPAVLKITTLGDGSGGVNAAEIVVSEPIDDSDSNTTDDVDNFKLAGTIAGSSFDSGTGTDDNTFTVTFASSASGTDAKDVTYDSAATGTIEDIAGNELASTPSSFVETDGAGPIATSVSPTGTIYFRSPTVQLTYSETVTVDNATLNSDNIADDLTTTDNKTFNYSTSNLADNTYTLTVNSTDAGSNQGTTTRSFTVDTTYDISLNEGWNLISFPVIPDDSSIETVLSGLNVSTSEVNSVWHYDAQNGDWLTYNIGLEDTLAKMEDGKSYWIDMNSVATLTVSGLSRASPTVGQPTYDLYTGWNMVGFLSRSNMQRKTYLGRSVGTVTDKMYEYDTATGWNFIEASDSMTPGTGYWIAVSENVTLYP